jgi:hypothetical protein
MGHHEALEALIAERYVGSGIAGPVEDDGFQLVLIGHTLAPSSYKVASKMTFEELFADLEQRLVGRLRHDQSSCKKGNWRECQFCKHHRVALDRV